MPGTTLAERRILDAVPYDEIEESDVEWLLRGIIPYAKLCLLVGPGGIGKGLFTKDIAVRIAMGWPMPPRHPLDPTTPETEFTLPGSVILITPEDDSSDTVKKQLIAAGANEAALKKIYDLTTVKRKTAGGNTIRTEFTIPQDLGILMRNIKAIGDVRLVVLDPLMAIATRTIAWNQQLRMFILAPLQAIARETGVAIAIAHHFNKGLFKRDGSIAEDALDRINGSAGLVQAMRSVVGIFPNPDYPDVKQLLYMKGNLDQSGYEPINYVIEGSGDDVHLTFATQQPTLTKGNLEVAERNLVELFYDVKRPLFTQEIANLTKLPHNHVKALVKHMVKAGVLEPYRGAYMLHKELVAAAQQAASPKQEPGDDTELAQPIG